ncbi:hypothetical protein UAW_01838 [Enterococcus haemoperoxidus ATCC BAA-382]|uniref:Tyr recombinase domain-containing protein n=1 Tax=Enterococcus haemoperoxidus ATCC BAA-382 TaxID=1158608 RepID=R2QN80_9ENTE|nr:tyrosine-type recombinase/integrase [Enterococcus haemoperoxidus]EOH96673.1 hypothetical protein UAW_01838 [Enterococcus haemoperoxidus ATCC BAA-382]EOT60169.1 hypothetical protein I583_02804 [Enterococcus haemoperoxidus ATCC BAA-382]
MISSRQFSRQTKEELTITKKGENIYKRKDGRWEGRYRKGRNEQGKLVYGYIYGQKYREVKQTLERLKARQTFSKQLTTQFQGTVEEWLVYWLDHLIVRQIKQSTYASYQTKMRKHILPYIGKKKLLHIEKKDITALMLLLADKELSLTTIHNVLTIFKSAMNKAYLEKAIPENPCDGIVLPAIRKKDIAILTREQQRILEKAALKEPGCSPIIIALYTGMRIGEIGALTWSDINLESKTIQVVRTIQRVSVPGKTTKTEIVFDLPKSKSSVRKIPIAQNLLTYLTKKKAEAVSTYVINYKHAYAEPRLINYWFKKTLAKADIEPIHFHALRHTFATRCIENGSDIATLSRLLGHQSIKLTLDTYASSLWETREKAISILDAELNLEE